MRRTVARLVAVLLVLMSCVLGLATSAAAAGGYALSIYGGTGGSGSPVPGPVGASPLGQPTAMASDLSGTTWIYLGSSCRVVAVSSTGTLSNVAGTGTCGTTTASANALTTPLSGTVKSLAVDSGGNLYVGDTGAAKIFKVTPAGALSVFAGNGLTVAPTVGSATSSAVVPDSMTTDRLGNIFVGWINRPYVLKITGGGLLSILIGNGTAGATTGGVIALGQRVNRPSSLAADSTGAVFIGDTGNRRITRVDPTGLTVALVAGTGTAATPIPGSPTSPVPTPNAMAVDSADLLYVAEGYSNQILAFDTGGNGSPLPVAGTGGTGTPVAGAAASSPLGATLALAAPTPGTLLAGDTNQNLLLRIAAPTAPGAPTGLSAVPGPGSATVTFSPPADNGGSAITAYQLSTNNGTTWSALTVTGTTTLTGTRTGLTNGVAYTLRVRAVNAVGTGTASASTSVTPATPPGAPLLPAAFSRDGGLYVTYGGPLDNGGSAILRYEASTDAGATWTTVPADNTLTGLTNGTAYTVIVRAVNAAGPGTATTGVTGTPRGAPTAPTGLSAVAGNRQAALTFTTPGTGGNPILGYQVSTDDGASWAGLTVSTSGQTNTGTVTGLANGTAYQVRVRAYNIGGNGAASTAVAVTPPVVPADAPTGLVVVSSSGTAALSFADPANTGGPITGYEASTDNGATWSAITVTTGLLDIKTATVTGLTNGLTYAVRVRVVNAAGPGAASTSAAANPRGVPYAPTSLTAVPGNRQAALTFTTPGDGGSSILAYQVSTDDGATWAGLTVATSGTTNTGTVTGLANGATYPVRVRAQSLAGNGIPSAATPVTLAALAPDAPTGLVVNAGNTTAALSFGEPGYAGGSPITGYEASTDDGTTWAPVTVTTGLLNIKNATVTGLTNGTAYVVRVRAVNAVGKGTASDAVSTTPRGAPYAPTNLAAVVGDRQATLTFTTPGDGGQPIVGYGVSTDDGATWRVLNVTTSGATNTGTVTGLTNGTEYQIRVRASNILGTGTPSAAVTTAVPALPPDAPTTLIATGGDTEADLTFVNPANTGGSPITGYEVSTDDGATWSPLTATTGLLGVKTATVTGLTNGMAYTIRVRARTAAGTGAASTSATTTPRGVPYAPTDLTATPGNSQAVLTFTTGSDGGYPITGYQVSANDGASWSALIVSTNGTVNTGTVTGLTNGTTYQIRVRATSLGGSGIASVSTSVRPATVPGAPTGVAAAAGNTQATVTFTPPANTGGSPITGYEVSTDNGGTWAPLAANGLVTGLTNGTPYTVRVRAVNAVGAGAASTGAAVTPIPATPDPPTGLSATRGDRSATLTFTAPAMTGTSAITGYEVSTDNGTTWAALPANRIVTGLTNGTTYTVRVRAVNSSGAGPASVSTTVTPGTVPTAPGPLSVQDGDTQVTVSFTAPASDGGDPVTGYQVSVDDGVTWTVLAPDRTVTGLTNGTTYRFRVRAVNGVGPGPATAGVDGTPATTPGAPVDISATPGDDRAAVSFTVPASDGGAPITGYEVSTDNGLTWASLAGSGMVTGLTNNTTYVVRVRARNRIGPGPASASTTVTPNDGLPGAPTGLTATRGDRSATLGFTQPANPGSSAITGYQVSTDGGTTWVTLPVNRTLTGLTNGTAYDVQVRAVNATGPGPASPSTSVTPATTPGVPASLSVVRGDRSATVTVTAPADDGGDPVTGYQVSTDDGSTWATLPANRVVTGLTNGTTYLVRVRAVNGVGPGAAGTSVPVTPATTTDAPAGLSAQRANGSATLTFTAPVDDGGDPITGYQVSTDDGDTWTALAANRIVTGLTNGVTYTVRVRAVNSSGTGAPSASVLVTPATTPGAPTDLSASAGDARAVLIFTDPDDGGDAITSFEVSADDGDTWATLAGDRTVTGLTDGVTYTVRVRAVNGVGSGPESASTTVTPMSGLPGAPTGLTAVRGNGSVTLTYTPPGDPGSGPVTGYDVSVDGGAHWAPLPGSGVVSGLTNGTAYTFWVRARNGTGPGPASAGVTATPATTPGAPAALSVTAGDRSATVTVTPPSDDGGDAVTGYDVSTDGGATWATLAGDGIVTDLTNGTTYTVRVRAVNGVGAGPPGAGVTVTPRVGVPDAPTDLVTTRGDRSATLTFTPPADPGSSPVVGYDVSIDDGGTWAPLAANRTVPGLTNGTPYTMRVRARNSAGAGPASAASTVVPAAAPGPPGPVSATAGDSSATLTFTAPADDGGTPVTGYQVSVDDGARWSVLSVTGTGTLTATVTGLDNGTAYPIRVRARNDVGTGTPGGTTTVTPVSVPGPPTALNASAGDSQAMLIFTAPGDDGGTPITAYQVSVDNGTTWAALAANRIVTGLTNNTTYTVRVRAVNAAGPGAGSESDTVTPVAGLPGVPTGVGATRGDSSATVTFTAPANTGSGPITGYEVSTDDGWNWAPLAADRRILALTNGTTYAVRIRALNGSGFGPASAAVAVTPAAVPGRPGGLQAVAGNTSAILTYDAPADDGGSPITSYEVSTDDGTTWVALPADGTVSGLTNGTTYPVRVRALNDVGPGAPSTAVTVTPATTAGAPGSVTAAPGDRSATVTFTAPADGGSPITAYEVSTDNGTTWVTLPADGTVTGLTNGTTYQLRLRARTAAGPGAPSAAVTVTPAAVPGAPTALTATPGDSSLTLTFTAPATGGSPITGYQVSTNDGATWAMLAPNRIVTGLTNGDTYTVRVRALNAAGTGPSSTSVPVTPRTVPGVPTGLAATPGDAMLSVTFQVPDDGGSAITGYDVSTDDGGTWASLAANGSVTGLVNGTAYVVQVRARNAAGTGAASTSVTATPVNGLPGPPSTPTVTRGDASAEISFTPGAGPVTGYQVSTDNGVNWSTLTVSGTTTLTGQVTGLTNGTSYVVRIRAVNTTGTSPPTTGVPVTPATNPGAPTDLVVTPGDRSASVAFTPPASDGGSAVTGYEVSTDGGTSWAALPANNTVTGLTNGTTYVVRVRARNAVGTGSASASRPVTPAAVAGAPTGVTAERGNGSATVTVTPPASDGGSPITGYEVSTDGGTTWNGLAGNGVVTGLTNGTPYAIRVRARTSAGAGAASATVTVTPATVPGAPTMTAERGDRSATVTVTAPTGDGGSAIIGYDVSTDGGTTWAALAGDGNVTGLSNGTAYAIRVRARNSVGFGAASAAVTVTPAAVPGAPTAVTAVRGDRSASVGFTPPAGPVSGYDVSTDDGATWAALAADGSVTGLSNGRTYAIRVRARNAVGAGPASAAVAVTPAAAPGAPTGLSAEPGDASAWLTFTAPEDGGTAITSYQVSTDDGGTWATLAADRAVRGLVNGTPYSLRVRAGNTVGFGAASAAVVVTPVSGLPEAPGGVSVVRGDASVTVTVDAANPPITGYEVSTDGGLTWAVLPAGGQVTGLTNGVSYVVRVRARSNAGAGPASPGYPVTPATLPSAPAAVSAVRGDRSAVLTLTAGPDGGSAITAYEVSTDGGASWAALAANRVVGGLVNGATYTVSVRAVNDVGTGPVRSTTVTPAAVPAAPAALTAARGDRSAALTLTPGPDGGSPVTGYEVSTDGGSAWAPLAANRVVTGLVNGTSYTVSVRAVNEVGAGPARSATVTPATVPGAPAALSAAPGDGSASLTLTAGPDGGSVVTGYQVSTDDGVTWSALAASRVVSGLGNGTAYRVRVRAVNAVGSGAASVAVTVTPVAGLPGAPGNLTVTRGNGSATLAFATPAGDPSGYEVSVDGGTTWAVLRADRVVAGLVNGTTYVIAVRAVNTAGTGPATAGVSVTPAAVPGLPDVRTVVFSGTTATLTFAAPADTGGSAIIGYDVSVDGGATWAAATVSGTGPFTTTVTGLTAGASYAVVLRARNAVGAGLPSSEYSLGVPSAPTNVAVSRSGTSATVTFTAPDDDTITGYEVSLDDGVTWTALPDDGVLTDLNAGSTYVVQVRAVNAAGPGRPSTAVTSSPLDPGAPRSVTATAGISSILVTWAPPASSAVPITGYRVVAEPGPATCTVGASVTSCRLGATAGVRYTVRVIALAAGDRSTTSAASGAVTPTAPTVPVSPPASAPSLTTSRGDITTAAPGAQFELVGMGFAPYSTVTIVIYSKPRLLATVTAGADGSFRKLITVPADLPAGRHTFLATGVDPQGKVISRTLTVTVKAATSGTDPAAAPGTGPSGMAKTGQNVALVAAVGLLLIGTGAVLLMVRRRPPPAR